MVTELWVGQVWYSNNNISCGALITIIAQISMHDKADVGKYTRIGVGQRRKSVEPSNYSPDNLPNSSSSTNFSCRTIF